MLRAPLVARAARLVSRASPARRLTTVVGPHAAKALPKPSQKGLFTRLVENAALRKSVRAVRVVGLCLAIFSAGQSYGVIQYAWEPEAFQKSLLEGILASVDCDKKRPVLPRDAPEAKRVQRVAHRVHDAARRLARGYHTGTHPANDRLPAADWASAGRRLAGSWRVVVVNTDVPNAFVHPMVPRTVFVNRGLISSGLCETDEELAFVLAHELGHSILKHGESTQEFNFMVLAGSMVVLLLLDPTGVLSLMGELGLNPVKKYAMQLPHSRQHETEADTIASEIVAKACYHPEGSSSFFKKLRCQCGGASSDADWASTHPAPASREAHVHADAHDPAVEHYRSHCIEAEDKIKQSLASRHHGVRVKSPVSRHRVRATVKNVHPAKEVELYWVTPKGHLDLVGALKPGAEWEPPSFSHITLGAQLVVIDRKSGAVLGELKLGGKGDKSCRRYVSCESAPVAFEKGAAVSLREDGAAVQWVDGTVVDGPARKDGSYTVAPHGRPRRVTCFTLDMKRRGDGPAGNQGAGV